MCHGQFLLAHRPILLPKAVPKCGYMAVCAALRSLGRRHDAKQALFKRSLPCLVTLHLPKAKHDANEGMVR